MANPSARELSLFSINVKKKKKILALSLSGLVAIPESITTVREIKILVNWSWAAGLDSEVEQR